MTNLGTKLLSFFSEVDWYVIRRHPLGWYWRADYLVVALLSANLASLFFEWDSSVPVFFTLTTANIWLVLAFDNADHVYRGNGITPIAIGTLMIAQPLLIAYRGHFAAIFGFCAVGIAILYYNKLILFAKWTREFRPSLLMAMQVLTFGCAVALVIFALATPNTLEPVDSPQAMRVIGIQSGERVAEPERATAPLQPAVRLASFTEASPSRPVKSQPDYSLLILLICSAVAAFSPVVLFVVRRLYRWVVVPVFDFPLHKRLVLGPCESDISAEWISRIRVYSASIPVFLVSFIVAFGLSVDAGEGWIMLIAMIAFILFVLLQARAFQPYMNDVRAQRGTGAAISLPRRTIWW